jgi:hypothetical protein
VTSYLTEFELKLPREIDIRKNISELCALFRTKKKKKGKLRIQIGATNVSDTILHDQ